MKQKIKKFFMRKTDKLLTQVAAEDRAALLTEKDVEFLRSIGVETDLETLRKETVRNKK